MIASTRNPIPTGTSKYAAAFIPGLEGLESGLGTIPGCDTRDPNYKSRTAEWRLAWFAKRRRIAQLRAEIQQATLTDAGVRAAQKRLCHADWAYFLTMYGWTYDPRVRADEDPDKPFILFAAQVNKVQEFQRVCADPRKIDIFDTKSRGIGWTDTYAGAALAGWLSTDWSFHFVSFKEDKVYRRNDRGSIFGKIEYKLEKLPDWLLPEGFEVESNMLRLNLYNPETGAAITGESTTGKTARGDRKTAIIYDECAFIPDFTLVYGVGAGTTNHRFCLSTESYEEGDDWEVMWQTEQEHGDPERVWEVDWWHNPYQDELWFEEEKRRWKADPHGFAREYLRDAEAAQSGLMYAAAKHCPTTEEHFDPTKTLIVSIDPGKAQDCAISWGQPIHKNNRKGIRWLGAYKRKGVPTSFFAHLLTGIPPAESDECWSLWTGDGFSERDRRLMAWFHARLLAGQHHEEWTTFCMDPAGTQEHAGTSFFHILYAKSTELLRREWVRNGSKGDKPRGIAPHYKFLQEQGNLVVDRVLCTQEYLPASEFSIADKDFWRAHEIQEALRKSKYTEPTPRSVSEPKPVHDDYSHARTTVEFASTYLFLGLIDPPKKQARKMLDTLRRKSPLDIAASATWKAA